jgi:SAM-dependent methyltransferase
MGKPRNTRETVLEASRAHYAHQAYYDSLLIQRRGRISKYTKRELEFIEHVFHGFAPATRPIKHVLDVACGNGRHIIGLASLGYQCTGLDYTAERVQIAKDIAKREGVPIKLLQGDATQLNYENEFDAVLAIYILFLLPNDDDVLKSLRCCHRALRKGGILICNIGNPFYAGKNWFSLQTIWKGLNVTEDRAPSIRCTEIARLDDFDPIQGVAWWRETNIIEAPDGKHVFRDRERLRLFTYWGILHYLQAAGFKEIKCYPDWKIKPLKKPKAEKLVFVSQKD